MSRFKIFLITALVSSILKFSMAAAPDTQPSEPQAEAEVERYQLKNRSFFKPGNKSRPPFWPIGHVKMNRNSITVAPTPMTKLEPSNFSITSIVLGNPSLAVINGRAYGEGEFLRAPRTPGTRTSAAPVDPRTRIRVMRIVDGLVTLQSGDGQSVVVPLRRPELNERKPEAEEQLLLGNQ